MRIVVKCVDSSPLDVCDNRADVVANVTCMLLDGGRETVGGRDRERERERNGEGREREGERERERQRWSGRVGSGRECGSTEMDKERCPGRVCCYILWRELQLLRLCEYIAKEVITLSCAV